MMVLSGALLNTKNSFYIAQTNKGNDEQTNRQFMPDIGLITSFIVLDLYLEKLWECAHVCSQYFSNNMLSYIHYICLRQLKNWWKISVIFKGFYQFRLYWNTIPDCMFNPQHVGLNSSVEILIRRKLFKLCNLSSHRMIEVCLWPA